MNSTLIVIFAKIQIYKTLKKKPMKKTSESLTGRFKILGDECIQWLEKGVNLQKRNSLGMLGRQSHNPPSQVFCKKNEKNFSKTLKRFFCGIVVLFDMTLKKIL